MKEQRPSSRTAFGDHWKTFLDAFLSEVDVARTSLNVAGSRGRPSGRTPLLLEFELVEAFVVAPAPATNRHDVDLRVAEIGLVADDSRDVDGGATRAEERHALGKQDVGLGNDTARNHGKGCPDQSVARRRSGAIVLHQLDISLIGACILEDEVNVPQLVVRGLRVTGKHCGVGAEANG